MVDEFNPEVESQEITEGIQSIVKFVKAPREQQIKTVRNLLDKQIGTDPGAFLATIPGLTPELTEMMTDPLLDLMAGAMVRALIGDSE